MNEPSGTAAHFKARPRMSVRDAIRRALGIGLAANVILFIVAMPLGKLALEGHVTAERVFDTLFVGNVVWHVFFGPDLHSMVWFCSVLALNFIIYSAVVFVLEAVFIFWRRRLPSANTNARIFP